LCFTGTRIGTVYIFFISGAKVHKKIVFNGKMPIFFEYCLALALSIKNKPA
jgi:hypothetical protein